MASRAQTFVNMIDKNPQMIEEIVLRAWSRGFHQGAMIPDAKDMLAGESADIVINAVMDYLHEEWDGDGP